MTNNNGLNTQTLTYKLTLNNYQYNLINMRLH